MTVRLYPGSDLKSSLNYTEEYRSPPSGVGKSKPSSSSAPHHPQQHDQPPPGQDEFPEGGARAWLTVSGASACLFVSFGWVNCAGIFQSHYQANQLSNHTASEVSWIPALQVFFMVFSGIWVGRIFDNYGPAILLAVGSFMHVFGMIMISLSTTYYQILLSQAICSAIGASMVFFPAFTCVSTWFLKKRGAAMGLVVCGSSIGGVIFPVLLINLIPKVGFPWAIRICAFLVLALLIWANMTVRTRIPPVKRPFEFAAFIAPLTELPFALLTAAIFFFYWGMFVPFTFIVVEALAGGMSENLANYLVAILNGSSIIGRTVPNIMADKLGPFNMMIIMAAFTTILILGVWLPSSGDAAIITFAVLFGIGSGAGVGLSPVLIASISPLQQIGARTGIAFGCASLAALTGSPIGGAIFTSSNGAFQSTKVFGGVACAIGTLLFIAARVSLVGFKPKKF
ncbi:major facilitator superfamily domain-containing protein [Triangularia verruculosa]|uniref:Major facilitator superfamily domain-containing protein n=1 Tax=Triangularia verruculosa TaxID=2587418 RepID=A0AAN6XCK0_9PEZI|nr:major facilitator superfamily domain-containing protein [Triangularia verruculosa]